MRERERVRQYDVDAREERTEKIITRGTHATSRFSTNFKGLSKIAFLNKVINTLVHLRIFSGCRSTITATAFLNFVWTPLIMLSVSVDGDDDLSTEDELMLGDVDGVGPSNAGATNTTTFCMSRGKDNAMRSVAAQPME